MKREDFILYDIILTEGKYKGLKSNAFPMSLEEAQKLSPKSLVSANLKYNLPKISNGRKQQLDTILEKVGKICKEN